LAGVCDQPGSLGELVLAKLARRPPLAVLELPVETDDLRFRGSEGWEESKVRRCRFSTATVGRRERHLGKGEEAAAR